MPSSRRLDHSANIEPAAQRVALWINYLCLIISEEESYYLCGIGFHYFPGSPDGIAFRHFLSGQEFQAGRGFSRESGFSKVVSH
jgi:hypothetical protein